MTDFNVDYGTLRSELLHAVAGHEAAAAAHNECANSLEAAAAAITEVQAPPSPPPPRPPVAFGDAVSVHAGDLGVIDVTANDQAGDGAFVSVAIVTPPSDATASVDGMRISYSIHPDASGPDELRYTVTDDHGLTSNIATVAISVIPNDPPPPPPPPPVLATRLTGFHPAHGTINATGAPVDVMASLQGCDAQLRPGKPSQIVGLWPLMDKWELMRPGRGMPANIFQRLTDNGQTALLTMPSLVRNPAANVVAGRPRGGEGDWQAVLDGMCDRFYDQMCEWIASQGQGHCRIRIGHEQGSEGWFPHSLGHLPDAMLAARDFSLLRAGTEYVMARVKRNLPDCKIVYSHFWQPYTKQSPTVKVFYHPDEFAPRPQFYDIGSVDWYDGKGQVISAANVDEQENLTRAIPQFGNKRAPQGLLAWEKYFKDLGKPFAVCEWGIVCKAPGQAGFDPARDNPFFIERMHRLNLDRGWAHCCYFNPHDRNGPHRLKDGTLAGTRRATDKYIQLYGA